MPTYLLILLSALAGAALVICARRMRKTFAPAAQPEEAPAPKPAHEKMSAEAAKSSPAPIKPGTPIKPTPPAAEPANLLLATMSHEIRTPLTGLLGMVQLLQRTDLTHKQRRTAQMIADSAQTLSHIVDDYLTFYRMESGEDPPANNGPVNLEETILQTMMLFQGLAHDKGLSFVLSADPDAPTLVQTDALKLRQTLSNLILNAIKYTAQGEVLVTLEQDGEETEIAVSDTGPGLKAGEVARLFEPYWRPKDAAGQEKGTGLGLSISQRLATTLGGRLEVDSEPGVGTTFSLRFRFQPLAEPSAPAPKLPWHTAMIVGGSASAALALADILERRRLKVHTLNEQQTIPSTRVDLLFVFNQNLDAVTRRWLKNRAHHRVEIMWLSDPQVWENNADAHVLIQPFSAQTVDHILEELASGRRRSSTIDHWYQPMAQTHPLAILVAEDDPTTAEVIQRMLEHLGYTPEVATTGSQALKLAKTGRFDALLLDLNLPDFGGVEILKKLPDTAAWPIAMSASAQPGLRQRCRDAGFRDFLAKPTTLEALKTTLMRALSADSGLTQAATNTDARAQIRQLFSRSPIAYRDLLTSHIAQTDLLCDDLAAGLKPGGDPQTAHRAAHTLQASAASLGCAQVAQYARDLDLGWHELPTNERNILAQKLLNAWHKHERADLQGELEELIAQMQ